MAASSEFTVYGRIGGLTKAANATPEDRARQRDVLKNALRSKYEADARAAFAAKGYPNPTDQEVAEAAERLRKAAQLRAAIAGGRAKRERARLLKGGR